MINGSIIPNTFSDHSGYMITYKNEYMEQPEAKKRPKNTWKFNNSLLQDKEFLERVEQKINYFYVYKNEIDALEAWEKTKRSIKDRHQWSTAILEKAR